MKTQSYTFLLCVILVNGHTLQPKSLTTVFTGLRGTQVGNTGVVTSPGYPRSYPPNQDEFMQIHVPWHSNVTLRFTYFDVQNCPSCQCDSVRIGGLPGDGRLCGSDLPNGSGILQFYNYDRNYIDVHFKSDASTQGTGFFMEYTIHDATENHGMATPGYGRTTTSMIVPPTTTTVPVYGCATQVCNYDCARENQVWTNSRGCTICECMAVASTTSKPHSVGSNSLLLSILHNLQTKAEAMELQAQSVKDSAKLAIGILQKGQDRRK